MTFISVFKLQKMASIRLYYIFPGCTTKHLKKSRVNPKVKTSLRKLKGDSGLFFP